MAKYEQQLPVNTDKETTLLISYETLTQLSWNITFAGEDRLLAETSKGTFSKGRQIILIYDNGLLGIISETMHDELVDAGRNKENVSRFTEVFENVKDTVSKETLAQHEVALHNLRAETIRTLKEHEQNATEIEEAMKLGSSNLYASYTIMALNVIIFILMAVQGAGIMEPNGLVHVKWGSNYGPLTLSGDWWRLLTATFLHFGVIHLAMNMYALYSISVYLEPMLGKAKYITAYLCTGVLASLTSLWWHSATPVNSAGASGAVFGLYGLFLALLTTDLIPSSIRKGLLTNISIFVGYNLLYGVKGGVDNSAHIGGLVSGLIIGYLYVWVIKKEKTGQIIKWALPFVVIATVTGSFLYIQKNATDIKQFDTAYNHIIDLQVKALEPLKSGKFNDSKALSEGISGTIRLWDQALSEADKMKTLRVPKEYENKLRLLQKYLAQRKEQAVVLTELVLTSDSILAAKNMILQSDIQRSMDSLKTP